MVYIASQTHLQWDLGGVALPLVGGLWLWMTRRLPRVRHRLRGTVKGLLATLLAW